ncbi:hypothetical protein V8G54_000026 (mitochondrion) [Vigna mungo]|uniref:Uncharacterized protein n=1 Tax=Vigna mungo TaxID=3915 RepID=A0AAQ3SHF7_VIGMU
MVSVQLQVTPLSHRIMVTSVVYIVYRSGMPIDTGATGQERIKGHQKRRARKRAEEKSIKVFRRLQALFQRRAWIPLAPLFHRHVSRRRDKREMLSISQKQIPPPLMLPRSAYRGIEREDRGPEQVGLGYRAVSARVWIREGNRSDVPLTQPGNGPEGTAAWGMSASRRKAHFSFLVIGRADLSDQGPGHKGPGTIQVRRTPEVTAMSRNLTHRPKRRANTRT